MAIPAHLESSPPSESRRGQPRRRIRLPSQAKDAETGANVMIHNISATGLLVETDLALGIGDRIEIGLPHAGATAIEVIWASGRLYGCRFGRPITPATLSAAQLRGAVGNELAEPAESPAGDESFGTRLQRLRSERGITQAELAAELGVSEPSISAWETDKARPKVGRVDSLAQLLGVSTRELLGDGDRTKLQELIADAKARIAEAAGARSDQVKIIIEY